MTIAREENFGPVLPVLQHQDVDEAGEIANDSDYGLNDAMYTTEIDRVLRFARRISMGSVELNGSPVGFHAPDGWPQGQRYQAGGGLRRVRSVRRTPDHRTPPEVAESVDRSAL